MTGQRIGYVRVSSFDQNPERQLDGTQVDRTFTDKASGKDVKRPELEALTGFARTGDNEPGVLFYTHVSDQYAPFHTKVINVGVRDATYVLDGLLYHESDLRIEEHYTDTAGFTDHVFALMHLLGFRFAPRIRAASIFAHLAMHDATRGASLARS